MADIAGPAAASTSGSALDRQTDALLRRFGAGKTATGKAATGTAATGTAEAGKAGTGKAETAKIEKSAKDFESILLGSWLQQAEQSFGTVPGGDDEDDDADPGKDQLQGMATQSLAGSLTAMGGIGIAKMLTSQLERADQKQADQKQADQKVEAGQKPAIVPIR